MPENSNTPTIAVVIAAKNASQHIGEALESLVAQSRLPDEIIIYDDGSSDETSQIAEQFSDRLPMLKLFRDQSCVGISKARNLANAAVNSDYIAVLDADDLFDTETVSAYLDFIRQNPDTDLIYADTLIFRDSKHAAKRRNYPEFATSRKAIRKTLGTPLIPFKHSSMVYRTQSVRELGGYDEALKIKVDIELFLRFQSRNKSVRKLNFPASFHRKHDNQISRNRIEGMKVYADLLELYEPDPLIRYFLLSKRLPSELAKFLIRG
ncbi:MAG: glycosyltransferase [Verrucomicrobiales bacterium]|nr:glycosyltransferase [Verrucomicrobiales bacterium]